MTQLLYFMFRVPEPKHKYIPVLSLYGLMQESPKSIANLH